MIVHIITSPPPVDSLTLSRSATGFRFRCKMPPSPPQLTSCAGGRHNMPPPRPASWQYLCIYIARWHLFRHVGYLRHQQQVDLWPFDLESGVRVTCDVGYLCANFSLPRLLCSRLRPDVRDRRQTSDSIIA